MCMRENTLLQLKVNFSPWVFGGCNLFSFHVWLPYLAVKDVWIMSTTVIDMSHWVALIFFQTFKTFLFMKASKFELLMIIFTQLNSLVRNGQNSDSDREMWKLHHVMYRGSSVSSWVGFKPRRFLAVLWSFSLYSSIETNCCKRF